MLSCVSGFLPTNVANIYIFLQSMLIWNIISSIIRKLHFSQAAEKEYRKYEQRTLSPVEEVYLNTIKKLNKEAKNKSK